MAVSKRSLDVVDGAHQSYEHPLYKTLLAVPGLSVMTAPLDVLLHWGTMNSLWVFPMATSCCGIELMAAAASRVDLDRMGTIVRGTPRQAEVMVIAGTITVKMAPRVLRLWEQMPEPKWAIAMGSCAISGDFYRDLYAVVPGVDTFLPVDIYIPGCPPNPEALMHGLLRLKEKMSLARAGQLPERDPNPHTLDITRPSVKRKRDPERDPALDLAQERSALEASSFDRDDEREAGAPEDVPYVPVEPSAGGEDLQALLRDEFGVADFPKDAPPIVETSRHVALARRLRALGFRQFVHVTATHFPAKTGAKAAPERFEIAYALRTIGAGSRVASWRLQLTPDEAAPTLVGVFAAADWQEREQWDLVGVRFDGHPDLRRLLTPADQVGHPLRKDFASDTACPPWR